MAAVAPAAFPPVAEVPSVPPEKMGRRQRRKKRKSDKKSKKSDKKSRKSAEKSQRRLEAISAGFSSSSSSSDDEGGDPPPQTPPSDGGAAEPSSSSGTAPTPASTTAHPPASHFQGDGPCLRFFVVGDPGEPGPIRTTVAASMSLLQERWRERGERLASFIVSTGDNLYRGEANEAAFQLLASEFLDRAPPLPWVVGLGNHDVTPDRYRWHVERHGLRGSAGWQWICPASAYRVSSYLDSVLQCDGHSPVSRLVDISVINTNYINKLIRRNPPGLAPQFYQAHDTGWWKEQKRSLQSRLARERGLWKIVVGHHPCEFVPMNMAEHRMPIARFFATTFMRGSRSTQKKRKGLAHVIRRGADLYLSGHQHLFAFMSLAPSHSRPVEETRCKFAIVGATSLLDQDPEESEARASSLPAIANSSVFAPSPSLEEVIPRLGEGVELNTSTRYSTEWKADRMFGFTVVELDPRQATIRFYTLKGNHNLVEAYSYSWTRNRQQCEQE
ncbi:MAG: metallophosphoesterase [archaeon]|nr:metallophosphoesterase [archaeon]